MRKPVREIAFIYTRNTLLVIPRQRKIRYEPFECNFCVDELGTVRNYIRLSNASMRYAMAELTALGDGYMPITCENATTRMLTEPHELIVISPRNRYIKFPRDELELKLIEQAIRKERRVLAANTLAPRAQKKRIYMNQQRSRANNHRGAMKQRTWKQNHR
jgi:hypothetical protein